MEPWRSSGEGFCDGGGSSGTAASAERTFQRRSTGIRRSEAMAPVRLLVMPSSSFARALRQPATKRLKR